LAVAALSASESLLLAFTFNAWKDAHLRAVVTVLAKAVSAAAGTGAGSVPALQPLSALAASAGPVALRGSVVDLYGGGGGGAFQLPRLRWRLSAATGASFFAQPCAATPRHALAALCAARHRSLTNGDPFRVAEWGTSAHRHEARSSGDALSGSAAAARILEAAAAERRSVADAAAAAQAAQAASAAAAVHSVSSPQRRARSRSGEGGGGVALGAEQLEGALRRLRRSRSDAGGTTHGAAAEGDAFEASEGAYRVLRRLEGILTAERWRVADLFNHVDSERSYFPLVTHDVA
jgi:hypothetical protein